jgi:hypothetical protein
MADFDGNCEIRRAGVSADGRAQLDLKATDGAFDWNWCFSKPERTREVLAAALTAIASNKLVYCSMPLPLAATPVVENFGLVK